MSFPSTLKGAAGLFIAAWWVHTIDPMRRGVAATPDGVVWSGTFVALLACVALTLIFTNHRSAPTLAAVVFPSIGLGVVAAHVPADWGALSDPIVFDSATDMWSIPAVFSEVLAAFWLGYVAFRTSRQPSDQQLAARVV